MTAEIRIVEWIKTVIARELVGKHMSAAMNRLATVEELLEAMFSVHSVPWLYSEDHVQKLPRRSPIHKL
jgi:hypothetical protein